MTSPFARTLRSLGEDRAGPSWRATCIAAALLGLWCVWFFAARVRVLKASETARLETSGAAHPLQSMVAGRVLFSGLELGREVKAGDVLLRLDARGEELQLVAAQTRAAGLSQEVSYLQQELDAQARAQQESVHAQAAGSGRAHAKQSEALARATIASEEASRLQRLRSGGYVSAMDALRSSATASAASASLEETRQEIERLHWDDRKLSSERAAMMLRLRRDIAARETERAELAVTIDRLEEERGRREVKSPVDGTLGDVAALPTGAVVQQGQKLGAVIPPGALRVVASFAEDVVGHLRPGQPARLRLSSFPWAQFGTVAAVVTSVGSEATQGLVRVELAPQQHPGSRISLQHGLTGTVEVEVERVAPADLVLRTIGRAFDQGRTP